MIGKFSINNLQTEILFQKWNEIMKKITELDKAMTAPMAPMAPRDYMAAMQHAAMQVKVFQLFFTQTAMGPGNMAMSNIGGMHQVRHSFKYVLTLFSGCNGPPDHE